MDKRPCNLRPGINGIGVGDEVPRLIFQVGRSVSEKKRRRRLATFRRDPAAMDSYVLRSQSRKLSIRYRLANKSIDD